MTQQKESYAQIFKLFVLRYDEHLKILNEMLVRSNLVIHG